MDDEPDPPVRRATHVDPEPRLERRLAGTLRTAGPGTWLAHVVDGVLCRDTDTLADHHTGPGPGDGTGDGTADGPAGTRAELRRFSRLLSMFTVEQGTALEVARTGALIRVVLDGAAGSAYCYAVLAHEHLTAVRVHPDGEPGPDLPAESAMGALATGLRRDLGLPDLTPGGPAHPPQRPVTPSEPHLTGGTDAPGWPAARDAADPAVLHWIGLVRGDDLPATADHFDVPDLLGHFHLIAVTSRRSVYEELARRADTLFDQLDRMVDDALIGPVSRIVLDVEQGAVVLHRLPSADDEFLVGVTLDQTQVGAMESRMTGLVRAWDG